MATNNTSSSNPRAAKMCDVLDALSSGIAKTAANEPKLEPLLLVPEVPAEPARQLLTEKMLAERWVCSVARLQRWRTQGGPERVVNCSNDLESIRMNLGGGCGPRFNSQKLGAC